MTRADLVDPTAVPDGLAGAGALRPGPGLWELLSVFTRIGATSFGGGLTGWMMRIVIDERGWMDMDDFLSGLAVCQALPGVNVLNLAVWIGFRLQGGLGALAACMGIMLPATGIITLMALCFAVLDGRPAHLALAGAAAAAIGLSLSVGIQAVRHSARRLVPAALVAATFVAVGLLKVSIVPVVLTLGTLGVLLEIRRGRRGER